MALRANVRVPPRGRILGASKRAGDVVTLFWTVLRRCRPIHANGSFYRLINVSLHLHAEIDISIASVIHYAHPLNTACIQI